VTFSSTDFQSDSRVGDSSIRGQKIPHSPVTSAPLSNKRKAALLMQAIGLDIQAADRHDTLDTPSHNVAFRDLPAGMISDILSDLEKALGQVSISGMRPSKPTESSKEHNPTEVTSGVAAVKPGHSRPSHTLLPKSVGKLAHCFVKEHPSIAAILMADVSTQMAGRILRSMPPTYAQQIALRLAYFELDQKNGLEHIRHVAKTLLAT